MNLFNIITLIKKSPEKLISWLLLAVLIFLASYLVISWPQRKAMLWEEIAVPEINREPVAKAIISVDFGDFLIRRPVTYYHDLMQRNPFARLPGVVGLERPSENDEEYIPDMPEKPEVRLIYRGMMGTSEGPIAFIDDGRETHVVREEDKIEGWRVIKIDREEVKVYNEQKGWELLLPLGGGPEEEERRRREAEEGREHQRERDGREDVGFEEIPPWLEEMPPDERRR